PIYLSSLLNNSNHYHLLLSLSSFTLLPSPANLHLIVTSGRNPTALASPRSSTALGFDILVIDLSLPDTSLIFRQIEHSCTHFGIFQMISHGVEVGAREKMRRVATEFLQLPLEKKMKIHSDDPSKTMRRCGEWRRSSYPAVGGVLREGFLSEMSPHPP
ncbi:Protein DOWNY MILDEW RESISTANCE 6, partial [Linum perenne]